MPAFHTRYGDIISLSGRLVPQYNNFERLYNSNDDVTERQITIEEDGWLQGCSKTAGALGSPFVRIYINGLIVYEANGVNKNYIYVWTPFFRVKKGDIVKYTLTTGTSDGVKELRLYKI